MSTAKKHHFIPQAFIKGFQSQDGYYYTYNKKRDGEILYKEKLDDGFRRYQSSDSIFFEWNRNTMSEMLIDENPLILETSYYKYFDDRFDSAIKALRDKPLEEARQSGKFFELINFINVTFLRIPKFDKGLEDASRVFFDSRYKVTTIEGVEVTDTSQLDELRYNESFLKELRFFFIDDAMEFNIEKHKETNMPIDLSSSDRNLFLLGDFPMLYANGLIDLQKLSILHTIFPISGSRAYYNFNLPTVIMVPIGGGIPGTKPAINVPNFKLTDHYLDINALIIDQSVELICGPDQQVLEESVAHYKKLKSENSLDEVRRRLFSIRPPNSGFVRILRF